METTIDQKTLTPPSYRPPSLPPYEETANNKPDQEARPAAAIASTSSTSPDISSSDPAKPADDPSDILPPAVLVIDRQSIYAESAPDVLLYQTNRGLASLGPPTRCVELERIERRRGPQSKGRPRHIYDLVSNASRIPLSRTRPEFYIRAVTSRSEAVGHFGLKKARLAAEWTARRVCLGCKESERTHFHAAQPPIFKACALQGICRWTDGRGRLVACQFESSAAAEAAGAAATATWPPRLHIQVPMRSDLRDALVGLWSCYVWEQAVSRHVEVPMPRPKAPVFQSHMFR